MGTPAAAGTPSARPTLAALAVLAAGVAVVASAGILIRIALQAGLPAFLIAFLRMGIAACVLLPVSLMRAPAPLPRRGEVLRMAAAGCLLALHFCAWISSLRFTTVAISTVLVTTNPLWVALASAWLLREVPGRWTLASLLLTSAGAGLLLLGAGQGAGQAGPAPLLGGTLALLGALSGAGYLLLGHSLRGRVALLPYLNWVYGIATLFLLAACLGAGVQPSLPSLSAALACLALALGPQLLGHGAINHALRHMPATLVALALLGEPVGAALLAWLLLAEVPTPLQGGAFVLILLGIGLGALDRTPPF